MEEKKVVDVAPIEQPVKKGFIEKTMYNLFKPGGLKDTAFGAIKGVVIPGLKHLAADALHGAVNSIFYRNEGGEYRDRYRGGYEYRVSSGSRRFENKYSNIPMAGTGGRKVRDFAITSEQDAWDIIEDLRSRISEIGYATIADYYENIGQPTGSYDEDYGWKSLGGVNVIKVANGWFIEFPPARRV